MKEFGYKRNEYPKIDEVSRYDQLRYNDQVRIGKSLCAGQALTMLSASILFTLGARNPFSYGNFSLKCSAIWVSCRNP